MLREIIFLRKIIVSRGETHVKKWVREKKLEGIFRQKNLKYGGLLRPPLGAECQNGVKMGLNLRATRVYGLLSKNEKSSQDSQKTGFREQKKRLFVKIIDK